MAQKSKTASRPANGDFLKPSDLFSRRHIGPNDDEIREMLKSLGFSTLEELTRATVPASILTTHELSLPGPLSEFECLDEMRAIAGQNKIYRNYIGQGYSDCVTPPVILRNIMENPGWYTQYTPYQSEIAQGRLEALLNFQTMIMDLTAMPIANASLLDEGTAAAEAMAMAMNVVHGAAHAKAGSRASDGVTARKGAGQGASQGAGLGAVPSNAFFISQACHPQTIEVVRTRAHALGLEIIVGDHRSFDFKTPVFGALVQYPATDGALEDYGPFIERVHQNGALAVVAADLLSLTLLRAPGEFGADVVVGNTQRFGVPLGFGGPHAAYFATKEEFKRHMPGRLVGISVDATGKPALRLALQTREQHIRRAKATSNICTAQVLLAIMASMYAVYHGPKGLKAVAERIHGLTAVLAAGLRKLGHEIQNKSYFDTLTVELKPGQLQSLWDRCQAAKINLRTLDEQRVCVSLDETTSLMDVQDLLEVFALNREMGTGCGFDVSEMAAGIELSVEKSFLRTSPYLEQAVFNRHHSETEMLRYLSKLQARDLSLTTSMIPLGSCTMKLNATAEMIPVTWPEFSKMHPFAPLEQAEGYQILFDKLESALAEITGFDAVSLQPNAGSQGEYAGLLVIRKYLRSRGQGARNVCLIPNSAHGTNPASASMAGMTIVGVETDSSGNINLNDLRAKAEAHRDTLAALMITYPSTHGVFEEAIREICDVIHACGGQVYLDGANMNAQVGLCRPAEFGADVCHLNLHKTFCIPHGCGGPGMGPIGVKKHLAEFLPASPVVAMPGRAPWSEGRSIGAISSSPWGSPSILPISLAYIWMMGREGLKKASQVAILNANYIAKRLGSHYPVLFKGREGLVAHECIIDLRGLKALAGVEVDDVAKRLMDYGFHAPTVSWPVAGTMMVEPTESEDKRELDRFCNAMIAIASEAADVAAGKPGAGTREENVLKGAPHTAAVVTADSWSRPYSREQAAFPSGAPWLRDFKFWPPVSRIDNPYGDRNLVCSCPTVEEFSS